MSNEDSKRTFDRQGYVFCNSFAASRIDEILENLDRVFLDVVPAMPSDHVFYYGESAKVDVVAQEKYQSELKAELTRTGKI